MRTALRSIGLASLLIIGISATCGRPSFAKESLGHPSPGWWDQLRAPDGHALARQALENRVVICEFWTFECINCRRTVPAMRALDRRYRGDARVALLGIHTPELPDERDPAQVGRAVKQLGLEFPIAFDPDYAIWRAFGNEYWPALYVLDAHGVIRYRHLGELHQGTPEWTAFVNAVDALRRELPAKAQPNPTRPSS